MSERLIRVYEDIDVEKVSQHLLVYGDLAACCEHCKAIDLKLNEHKCPQCNTEFKYISFRNVKSHLNKIMKLKAQRPSLVIIDYDDYKKSLGVIKAQKFLR